jgi:hypothetical protein
VIPPAPTKVFRKKGRGGEGVRSEKQSKKAKNLKPHNIIRKRNELKKMMEMRGEDEKGRKEKRREAKRFMENKASEHANRCRMIEGARQKRIRQSKACKVKYAVKCVSKCVYPYLCDLCIYALPYLLCLDFVVCAMQFVSYCGQFANYLCAYPCEERDASKLDNFIRRCIKEVFFFILVTGTQSVTFGSNLMYAPFLYLSRSCAKQYAKPSSLIKVMLNEPVYGCLNEVKAYSEDTINKRQTKRGVRTRGHAPAAFEFHFRG